MGAFSLIVVINLLNRSMATIETKTSADEPVGLPLPQFHTTVSGGGPVHQKPQKYPEREIRISIEDDFSYNNNVANAPIRIRMGFLKKVYGILTAQVLLTVIVCAVFMTNETAKQCIQSNQWLVMISAIATFGVLFGLHMNRNNYPTNFILLASFTLLESIVLGSLVTFYESSLVLQAFLLTLSVTVILTLYAWQTKQNYTSCGATLFVSLWLLILASFILLFFNSEVMEVVLSIGGVALFSMFIIYDTQMIMMKVSPEEYISASIELYLDMINLFIYILRILKAARRD